MVIQLKFYLLCMLSGPEKKVHFFNKIQDGRLVKCYSEELELHRFVPRKQLTLAIYCRSGNIREVLIFLNFARRTSSRIQESCKNYYYYSATGEK